MNNLELENWMPMEPQKGPPLPRFLNIYWPWYKPEEELPPIIYTCPYCGATFSSQRELQDHIATEHPTQPMVYTCPHCGATFSTEKELNEHIAATHPTVPPAGAPQISAVTLDQTELLAYDKFTISITFDNPTDSDIWLKPKYAFGNLTNGEFVAEKALCQVGFDPQYGYYTDYTSDQDWDELGGTRGGFSHYGSGMGLAKDPEGNAVKGKSDVIEQDSFWLKVPAKGQATTSFSWLLAGKEFAYGPRDICVRVEKAFYLVHDPGWATITVRVPPTTFTGQPTYQTVTVNWRPVDIEPFSAVAQDIATIGLAPGAITIDGLEVRTKWTKYAVTQAWGMTAWTKVTVTNHTNRTFGQGGYGSALLKISSSIGVLYDVRKYLDIPYGYGIKGLSIPPGTTTFSFSERPLDGYLPAPTVPEGSQGTALVQVVVNAMWDKVKTILQGSAEAGFKGIFSSTNQVWTPR